MALPVFPSYAKVLLTGFGQKADFGVLRTDMDGGIAKQRRRFSMPIVTRSVSLQITSRANKLAFDAWMSNELQGGTGWFTWYDPVERTSKRARFVKGELDWKPQTIEIWTATGQLETLG